MYTVYNKKNTNVRFDNIQPGDVFVVNGKSYLKMQRIYIRDSYLNALNTYDGCPVKFNDYDVVVLYRNAQLVLSPNQINI